MGLAKSSRLIQRLLLVLIGSRGWGNLRQRPGTCTFPCGGTWLEVSSSSSTTSTSKTSGFFRSSINQVTYLPSVFIATGYYICIYHQTHTYPIFTFLNLLDRQKVLSN